MDCIIEVTGGKGGTSYLVLGRVKVALIDCGMAYCSNDLIGNIKVTLGDRKLDYIFLSHSHYDHIGAIPYLREVWPDVTVLGAEYAKNILNKDSALKTIRELSNMAKQYYGSVSAIEYDDNLLKVDCTISDEEVFDLGGVRIRVLESQGHTKCSLSFLINEEIMFASETAGVISLSGKIHPNFICSYRETIKSIRKCQEANPKLIISPHYGLVSGKEATIYWKKCIEATEEGRELVLKLSSEGADQNEIFDHYCKVYQDEGTKEVQPDYAFEINNRAMIKMLINEK